MTISNARFVRAKGAYGHWSHRFSQEACRRAPAGGPQAAAAAARPPNALDDNIGSVAVVERTHDARDTGDGRGCKAASRDRERNRSSDATASRSAQPNSK